MTSNQARHSVPAGEPAGGAVVHAGYQPTALRIALGAQLRRLREASQITTDEAGQAIRATHSKISRLERGRSGAKQRDVADLLSLYGVTDETEREGLLTLARQANTPGWWQQYNDILPKWFELYVGLEKAASIIRTYEVQFVHGLLQTRDYARAVILIANAHARVEEIDRRVSLRMKRQQLLTQPDAPELWAVLDEASLRRPLGGRTVMRAQLEHLPARTTRQTPAPQLQAPVHSQADYARHIPLMAAQPGEATRDRQFVRPWPKPAKARHIRAALGPGLELLAGRQGPLPGRPHGR